MNAELQTRNRILCQLPADERRALLERMRFVPMSARDSIYESEMPLEYACFPDTGVMSIVTLLSNGVEIEATTVGFEGMVGIPILLGTGISLTKAFCQVPGNIWRISASDLKKEIVASHRLHSALHHYTQTAFDLLAQSCACNRMHSIEERCAKWLLLTQDRVASDTFQLTHEFLATMIGVRRAGVTIVAQTLQAARLIQYKHGTITILDRPNLENVACECYFAIRKVTMQNDQLPLG